VARRHHPLEGLTDAQLLQRVGRPSDDGQAFGVFYRRHEDRIVAYLRRRLPHADLAADLAAETFASALGAAPRFVPMRADGDATAWLLTIAHNAMVTSIRRGRVADDTRRRLRMTEPLVLADAALERVEELASMPENLHQHLAELPAKQRDAILAHVVEERPYDEIAADLQCSELVVRQRVSRGLARLRRTLSPGDPS
jgi:RNA polymerase sigma factor (sigma-70 family)